MFDIYTSHLPAFPPSALFMLATMSAPKDKSVVVEYSFRIIASQPEADEIFSRGFAAPELKRICSRRLCCRNWTNLRHDFEFAPCR